MRLLVRCARGLETTLRWELQRLGIPAKSMQNSVQSVFVSDSCMGDVYKINYHSRVASSVSVLLSEFVASSRQAFLSGISEVPWASLLSPSASSGSSPYAQCLKIGGSLPIEEDKRPEWLRSTLFLRRLVKSGICDRMRDEGLDRPTVDLRNPFALPVDVWVDGSGIARVCVNTSGKSLVTRDYLIEEEEFGFSTRSSLAASLVLNGLFKVRHEWTEGASDEPVGDAMARLNWTILDPLAGSGCILIEAALLALGDPPGRTRSELDWGFLQLRGGASASARLVQGGHGQSMTSSSSRALLPSSSSLDSRTIPVHDEREWLELKRIWDKQAIEKGRTIRRKLRGRFIGIERKWESVMKSAKNIEAAKGRFIGIERKWESVMKSAKNIEAAKVSDLVSVLHGTFQSAAKNLRTPANRPITHVMADMPWTRWQGAEEEATETGSMKQPEFSEASSSSARREHATCEGGFERGENKGLMKDEKADRVQAEIDKVHRDLAVFIRDKLSEPRGALVTDSLDRLSQTGLKDFLRFPRLLSRKAST
eukprot:Cvel_26719.t1-p1 / transcript=Cvel_26719.t1 / gene=Cvel_26719 / organism=Chromera_velia_CCMP2878 / gene_product=Ribosomal RNA large subunit methyltransferase K/L, putative / transcript_product=Ribosomal RNA large subunit methyltransferase K/L, putative / location=Cvel_scaffold3223:1148-4808(-) / protein_length=537 / sequence_SO=supercontig / SO=protein_coding / is_pseudo=false